MKKLIVCGVFLIGCISFITVTSNDDPVPIPRSQQRFGNADSGYQYIISGDYVKSGLPLNLYQFIFKKEKNNLLDRAGDNSQVRYDFNVVKAVNGESVVVPNCFQCHAQFFDGKLIIDLGKFLMGSSLLTTKDTVHAKEVDTHMPDVLSYLYTIEPPKYPKGIDEQLAGEGETIFENNCSRCHGTYGANGQYPNLLIPESIIGTDSLLNKSNYQYSDLIDWYNKSWFSKGDHPATLAPFNGYIAPPLDGVWITA